MVFSPPAAIGTRVLTWEPVDPVAETRSRWVFLPATQNTRRLPSYGYDTNEPLTGGMRTADQNDGWNGAPDRYDWKLIGKRELLIGYNAYKLADRKLNYKAIIQPHHLDPDLLRYELHRVWVVEATCVLTCTTRSDGPTSSMLTFPAFVRSASSSVCPA